jgi:hypothetical protein
VDRLSALTEGGKALGGLSTVVTRHDHVTPDMWHTVCLAGAVQCTQLGTSLADSLARCNGRRYFSTVYTQVQYQSETGGSYVEKPARDSDYLIWLASHLSKRLTSDLEDVSLNPLC